MNFTQFITDLSQYGTVEYCDYNGTDTSVVLVVLSNFNPVMANLSALLTIIHTHTGATHPTMTHSNISDGVVKIQLNA